MGVTRQWLSQLESDQSFLTPTGWNLPVPPEGDPERPQAPSTTGRELPLTPASILPLLVCSVWTPDQNKDQSQRTERALLKMLY